MSTEQIDITGAARPSTPEQPPQPTVFEQVANVPTKVKAFGKEYEIGEFNLGQIARSTEFVAPFSAVLRALLSMPRECSNTCSLSKEHEIHLSPEVPGFHSYIGRGKLILSDEQATSLLMTAFAISGPSLIGLLSVATYEPVEFLEAQKDRMGAIRILSTTLKANLDFFSPENIAALTEVLGDLAKSIQGFFGGTLTTS